MLAMRWLAFAAAGETFLISYFFAAMIPFSVA